MLMIAGAVVSLLYVLAAPSFSAFRLELVFLPMAAYGIAWASTLLLERLISQTTGFGAARDAIAAALAIFAFFDPRHMARPSLNFGALSARRRREITERSDRHLSARVTVRRKVAHTQRLWRRLPSWRRAALATCAVVVALVQLAGSGAAVHSPGQVGEWSAPSAWPIVAVHMSLEPSGNVFALDGFGNALNSERLWDPATGAFVSVPYGRNLFCSGHIQLADGRTLVVGGHINANEGLADTTIFNPATRTYLRGPDMSVGRWYPTATQLPDGRVLAFSGDNIIQDRPGVDPPLSDASVNSLPSVYNPRTSTWNDLEGARLTSPLYPFMFVLSDGRIFDAGPDKVTRILDPATWTWSTVGTSPIDGHSAVMYRPNKIMKSGTWADPDFNGANAYNADGRTAVIDMSAPTPAWRSTASMATAAPTTT